jgi:archaellum component FlaG (FlaF/FlaG flagellin family)
VIVAGVLGRHIKTLLGNLKIINMGNPQKLGNFVNALFQDASNNVGIGAAPSGSYKLEVTGTAKVSSTLLVSGDSTIGGTQPNGIINYTDATSYGRIYFSESGSFKASMQFMGSTFVTTARRNALEIVNTTTGDLALGTGDARTFYIKNGGNVGIGTTAPNSSGYGNLVLTIGNGSTSIDNAIELFGSSGVDGGLGDIAFLNGADTGADKRMAVIRCNRDSNNTSGAILFYTKNTGSFQLSNRITSVGQIISACTGSVFSYDITNNNSSTPNGIQIGLTAAAFNNTSQRFLECYTSTGDKFRVYTNGNVVNSNNSYGPLSDIKLKENITDTSAKLDKLMQVRIVNYNLINDPELKQIGVIAQELEQVFPGLVDEHQDTDREGNDLGSTTKSVKMSVFVPILIKAMQEQNQIIQELNERLNKAGL